MLKLKVVRETTWRWSEKPHRPQDPSENHANTIGKRDVFENGAVAVMFFTFSSSPNSGNSLLFELADLKLDQDFN